MTSPILVTGGTIVTGRRGAAREPTGHGVGEGTVLGQTAHERRVSQVTPLVGQRNGMAQEGAPRHERHERHPGRPLTSSIAARRRSAATGRWYIGPKHSTASNDPSSQRLRSLASLSTRAVT